MLLLLPCCCRPTVIFARKDVSPLILKVTPKFGTRGRKTRKWIHVSIDNDDVFAFLIHGQDHTSSYCRWMVVGQMTDFLRQILSSMLFLLVTDGDDEARAFCRYSNTATNINMNLRLERSMHSDSMKEGWYSSFVRKSDIRS